MQSFSYFTVFEITEFNFTLSSGKFEFTIGDVKKIVQAGDALYQQPNVVHGCVCLEDGMLIDVFSPMRDTFIQK